MPPGAHGPGAARWWRVPAATATAAAVLLAGPHPLAMAEVPEPPLVVDVDAADGRVRLSPAIQEMTEDGATWLLTNGGTGTLTFELGVHGVEATEDAVEVGEPLDVSLGLHTVTLGPSEAARIPVPLAADAPDAVALVASTVDAEPETRLAALALRAGGGSVEPSVRAADATRGEVRLRLRATGPAMVDVALRASAWPGLVQASAVVEGVYVPAGGRDLVVRLDGPLAGRLTVDVAVAGAAPSHARAELWWWPRTVVLGLLAGLAVVGVAAALATRRRRR